MKRAKIEKTLRAGSLALEIKRYADGRLGFDYMPAGEARVRVRLHSLHDAERKARELMGAAEAGKVERLAIDPDEYSEFLRWKAQRKEPAMVPRLVQSFLQAKEGQGVTDATVRELKSTLLPFAIAFPDAIAGLRREKVEQWMSMNPCGPRRWNNKRAAICALHRFARHEGLLPADLTPVERMARKKLTLNVETYSPEEMEKLLAVVPKQWLPLIVLGGFCGLRPEEISPDPRNGGWKPGLHWENILWGKRKIDVPAAVSKVRKRRFAVLTDAAAAFLQDWQGTSGAVVPGQDRHKFNRGWSAAAGVPWKDNGLRHSYASYRLAVTKDAPALALEMGNSPGMIFNHYLDLKHEDEAEAWFAIRPAAGVPKGSNGSRPATLLNA